MRFQLSTDARFDTSMFNEADKATLERRAVNMGAHVYNSGQYRGDIFTLSGLCMAYVIRKMLKEQGRGDIRIFEIAMSPIATDDVVGLALLVVVHTEMLQRAYAMALADEAPEVEVADPRAKYEARRDIVKDVLSRTGGRSFGIEYVKLDGTERTMNVQVADLGDNYATLREINKTRTGRALYDSRAFVAYRTVYYDRVRRIRDNGFTYDFDANFGGV